MRDAIYQRVYCRVNWQIHIQAQQTLTKYTQSVGIALNVDMHIKYHINDVIIKTLNERSKSNNDRHE